MITECARIIYLCKLSPLKQEDKNKAVKLFDHLQIHFVTECQTASTVSLDPQCLVLLMLNYPITRNPIQYNTQHTTICCWVQFFLAQFSEQLTHWFFACKRRLNKMDLLRKTRLLKTHEACKTHKTSNTSKTHKTTRLVRPPRLKRLM